MINRPSKYLLALYCSASLFACAMTSTVVARDLKQDEALQLREGGHIMPLEELFAIISRHYPGARLLEVELEEENGLYIYEIELITRQGVVREIELDARTGRILQDEEDD